MASWAVLGNSKWPRFPDLLPSRMSCSYLLCTILLFVAVLLAVTVTGIILLMNHYQAPSGPDGPPLISTNQDEGNALVTIERGDGSRINIFIDPNCPDYNNNFLRLEGVQTSLLHSLTDHDTDLKSVKGQDRALLVKLAEEVAKLSAHANQLKMEYNALRQGQGNIGQELSTLQTEQGRLIQLLSESQINMVKVVNSVSDALSSMQKETGNIKSRLKADLQRAPVHSVRPKGCAGSRPRDCSDIYASGQREDGIYSVFPTHYPEGFQVFCDMTTDGGGWTVIQRREDGSVNFFRDWEAYREGFGKITGEHWLGKPSMSLSVMQSHQFRVWVTILGKCHDFHFHSGCLVTRSEKCDSLLKHNGMKFTTKDKDNDHSENNCASFYHGAWWYRNCHTSNLNGQYLRGQHTSYADGIEWSSWTGWQYSLKFTEMKIRPTKEENK
uniref:Fibrinogen C domain containing 1 n=1 Tax=Cyprinus carpio TaxID=7962 RepID=A0A8C1XRX5_CYPCA